MCSRSSLPILVAACLAPTVLLAAPGCNITAPAAYMLFGPGTIPAEHTLAPVRTVVFVDDRSNVLPRTVLRVEIGDRIAQELLTLKLVPSVVAPRDAIALTRQREDGTRPLSIAAIGRELEAQQVVYVQVNSFTLAGDGAFANAGVGTGVGVTPTAKASIKVIDIAAGERTYPLAETGGREIVATTREIDPGNLRTVAQRRAAEEALAQKLGTAIAKLFYEHDRVPLGENLGPRTQ
jgi:hypothetical protein